MENNPQLLADLESVWECLDQAWGHTGTDIAHSATGGMRGPGDEDVCTVCVEGAIKRMLGVGGDRSRDATRAIVRAAGIGELCPGRWSERSTKAQVMHAVRRAIVEAGGQ